MQVPFGSSATQAKAVGTVQDVTVAAGITHSGLELRGAFSLSASDGLVPRLRLVSDPSEDDNCPQINLEANSSMLSDLAFAGPDGAMLALDGATQNPFCDRRYFFD